MESIPDVILSKNGLAGGKARFLRDVAMFRFISSLKLG
jgi:hypothetical protein